MWGSAASMLGLGGEDKKEDDEEVDMDGVIDYDSVARAKLQAEGVELPPIAKLYEKDNNKEEQISNLMQQYTVLLEFQRMLDCLPSGMYVSPSHTSILAWHGIVFVRTGPYRGGIFKFQLDLPEEYPEFPPSLHFITDVFHPMIEPSTGRIDLDTWYSDWKPGTDYAACILPRIHKALSQKDHFIPKTDSFEPLNHEAGDLLRDDYPAFLEKVKECVEASQTHDDVFENPEGSLLRFSEGPAESHEILVNALRETDVNGNSFEDRKSMYVEWFCDYYVRNEILKTGKKKKKKKKTKKGNDKMMDKRVTGSLKELKEYAEKMAKEEEEDEDDDEEDDDDAGDEPDDLDV